MATKKTAKTISKKITGVGDQQAFYREILVSGNYRLRIDIKSDSVTCQSHAKIEVFSAQELAWHELYTILGEAMATKASYKRALGDADFSTDRAELLRVAEEILETK